MKKVLPFLMFAFIGLSPNAQTMFQKTYGGSGSEVGNSVKQTTDGGYIITGYTTSFGAGNYDVYLIKTNANGDIVWTKTFGGTGVEYGYSVQQTTDGGYIIAGQTNSFGAGNDDVYLIKTNSNGDSLWTKTYGGSNTDYGRFVLQTPDGGYIIAGGTASFGNTNGDIYLIKTDSVGDTLWTKTYDINNGIGTYCMQPTNDGGYIISGRSGFYIAYMIKVNSNGIPIWTKNYNIGQVQMGLNSVQQTIDGGYILSGSISPNLANNVFLIKTDSIGDTLWIKKYGGSGDNEGNSLIQARDGGYIICGLTNNFGGGNYDVYLIKTNSNGDTLWTKTYGGINGDIGLNIQQTTDGGYIITGSTGSFGAGSSDVYLIKTDSLGNSGCNQYNTATVTSIAPFQVSSPTAIVSSGGIISHASTLVGSGGIINTLCFSEGINEITKNTSLTLYPNPTSGTFTLSYNSQLSLLHSQFKIYDITGRKVYTQSITNPNQSTIDVSGLSNGIYYWEMIGADKETFRGKFVIEK